LRSALAERRNIVAGIFSRRLFNLLASATLCGAWARRAAAAGKIRIGLPVPKYTPCSVVTAAEELGFYKKNGVSAEISAFGGGNTGQEALIGGAVDLIIYFPASVALAVKKGVKEKIVGVGEIKATG
jgi:NitT/TauT family transport system substrate-binding protein